MRLACLSDGHLCWDIPESRLDDIVETEFKKLRFVFDWCKENKVEIILQAGDLTDKPRSWHLLPLLARLLKDYHEDVEMLTVWGQHNTYLRSEASKSSTMLGVLEETGLIYVLCDDPVVAFGDKVAHIYGASWGEDVPKIKDKDKINILVIHAPIGDSPIYPGHDYTDAEGFLEDNPGFDFILCGDVHRKFQCRSKDDRMLINVGPMLRREATQYNFTHKPCFFVYDTKIRNGEFIEIPHLPANRILTREHIESEKDKLRMLEEFIDSLNDCEIDHSVSFEENLDIFAKNNGIEQRIMDLISETMARVGKR